MGETYQYQPLAPATEIRLLTLLPGIKDESLQGEIRHANLLKNEAYETLSYTWGAPETPESISIEGRGIPLTANCRNAVRSLRRSQRQRTVWIDAICINQKDVDEKGQQVGLMGHIYSRASRTVVYLGAGDGTVDRLRSQSQLGQGAIGIRPGQTEDFNEALARLMSRPWFTRKWIIQEVLLSPYLEVQCGVHPFKWGELETLDRKHECEIINIARKYLHLSSKSASTVNGRDWDPKAKKRWNEMYERGEVVMDVRQRLGASKLGERMENLTSEQKLPRTGFLTCSQLFDMLCLTSGFGCKEPRDSIYALLSLFAEDTHIKPDYKITDEAVWDMLTSAFMMLGETRMFWLDERNSWKPRWGTALPNLSEFIHRRGRQTGIGRAWTDVQQERAFPLISSSLLENIWTVTGVFLSRVQKISNLEFEPWVQSSDTPGLLDPNIPLRNWKAILASLGLEALEHEKGQSPLAHIHERNRKTVPWFRRWTLDVFGEASSLERSGSSNTTRDAKAVAHAMAKHHGKLSFCKGYYLFISDNDLIGIAPGEVKQDDMIYFLPGHTCPFCVLRPVREGRWVLIALAWLGPLTLFPAMVQQDTEPFTGENLQQLKIILDEWVAQEM